MFLTDSDPLTRNPEIWIRSREVNYLRVQIWLLYRHWELFDETVRIRIFLTDADPRIRK
jgi:hypothetical protein